MSKHLISRGGFALSLLLLAVGAHPLAGQTAAEAIHPGDVVRLTVIREKELSGDFPVNQFGTVVLPLVGEYDVSKETNRTLREKVIRDLREIRQARDVELVVLRKVRVVGEVNAPGVYPLDPTMTIADAIAMAKGRTELGQEGKVILRRGSEVVSQDLREETQVSQSPILSGDEIRVPRRGWVDRNLTAVVAGVSTLVGVTVTLILR